MSSTQSSSWAQGAPPKGRGGLVAWAIILGILLIAVIVVVALALRGLLPFGATAGAAASEDTTLTLEPANSLGQDPFASTTLAATVSASPTAAATRPTGTAASAIGSNPGLYGGSNDPAVCKVDQLVAFLGANPAKAQAWVDALNTDPNLRWPLGRLTVADIPKYVAQLTAVQLTTDTRVTNHGFSDSSGTAYPLQSLLQKGTAVLVDKNGVPRVKCNCGNPLLPPTPITPPNAPPVAITPPASATPCLDLPEIPDGMGPENPNPCPPSDDPPPADPPADSDCVVDPNAETFDCLNDEVPIEGEGWEGLGEEPITVITPSDEPLTELQVADPDDPGALRTIPTGCLAAGQCTLDPTLTNPNAVVAAESPAADPGTSPPPSESAAPAPVTDPVAPTSACSEFYGDSTRYDGTFTNNTSAVVYLWAVGGPDQGCAITFVAAVESGGGFTNVFGTPGFGFIAADAAGSTLQYYTVEASSPAFTLG